MDERGKINKMPDIDLIKKDIFSISISDEEIRATIKNVYQKYGKMLEPHGAVGFAGFERFLSQAKISLPSICLETAHPSKFPEEIKKILNLEPRIPESMRGLGNKKETFEIIPPDYQQFKQFLYDYSG